MCSNLPCDVIVYREKIEKTKKLYLQFESVGTIRMMESIYRRVFVQKKVTENSISVETLEDVFVSFGENGK